MGVWNQWQCPEVCIAIASECFSNGDVPSLTCAFDIRILEVDAETEINHDGTECYVRTKKAKITRMLNNNTINPFNLIQKIQPSWNDIKWSQYTIASIVYL